MSNDGEREELKNALIGTQESAAVQILLEAVRPVPGIEDCDDDHVLSNLKEVQSLVCSYLHETFIGDPNLAKLVHFQASTYIRGCCIYLFIIDPDYNSNCTCTGLSLGAPLCNRRRRSVDAYLPRLRTGVVEPARLGEAGIRRQSHIPPFHSVRLAQVLFHRPSCYQRTFHIIVR